MKNVYGKLFQNVVTRELQFFSYDPSQDYYTMVQNTIKNGFQQCIFTSSVMLSIIEELVLSHKALVTKIEFMEEDEELDSEISSLLSRMKDNSAYWEVLKQRLSFLSKYDSIDVRRVDVRCNNGDGFLLSLFVNGIMSISQNAYEDISSEVAKAARRMIS